MSGMLPRATEGSDPDPSSLPEVAAEDAFDGTVTVYLRSSAPDVARERQQAVLNRIERLESAGALDDVETVRWPNKVSVPGDGPESETVACYDEFLEAVGPRSLEPFFEERPGIGRLDRVIVLPVICLAARRGDELVGIYPQYSDGTHESIEDGLDALAEGTAENV